MKIDKHKVFISYYHKDDQSYKDYLTDTLNKNYDLFVDWSVREKEIDDSGKSSETIRKIIRDDYIRESTVLILLCGENTSKRKHVDWEIHAAMYDTELNPKMGIIVINLPDIENKQSVRVISESQKEIIAPNSTWHSLKTRKEFEEYYPYLPGRIIDSLLIGSPITIVNWSRIKSNPDILKNLIDIAYKNRKTAKYDLSSLLRRNNS